MLCNLFLFLFLFVVVFPHRRSESNKRLIILPPSFIVALSAATNPPASLGKQHGKFTFSTWNYNFYIISVILTFITLIFKDNINFCCVSAQKFLCDKMLLLEKRRWLSSGSVITAMIAAMSFLRWLRDVFYVPSIMWRSFTRRHLCDALIALMTVMGGGDLGFLWLLPHIWGFQRRHTFPLCLVIAGTSSS